MHDVSSKLWHCRLCHISRERIERLIKKSILPPLQISDLEQCIDCIKGKYVKKIKKDAKRSAWILEIIHTDICGPFPVKSVDGYDCHFGNGKYRIVYNNKCVGLAFRQDKLYLLSLYENMNDVSTKNENVFSSMNATKKRKRVHDVSSKLWHCRLGHISRGNRAID